MTLSYLSLLPLFRTASFRMSNNSEKTDYLISAIVSFIGLTFFLELETLSPQSPLLFIFFFLFFLLDNFFFWMEPFWSKRENPPTSMRAKYQQQLETHSRLFSGHLISLSYTFSYFSLSWCNYCYSIVVFSSLSFRLHLWFSPCSRLDYGWVHCVLHIISILPDKLYVIPTYTWLPLINCIICTSFETAIRWSICRR